MAGCGTGEGIELISMQRVTGQPVWQMGQNISAPILAGSLQLSTKIKTWWSKENNHDCDKNKEENHMGGGVTGWRELCSE